MNRNGTLIEIEDLMLNICSGKYHWKEVHFLLDDYRQLAHDIYEPKIEYSPMLHGYFDLMLIHRPSRLIHRTKSNSRLFESKTDFMNFCDDLLDEHHDFIQKHKRQRRRNFTSLKDNFQALLAKHCKLLLVRVDVSYPYDADVDIQQFNADLQILRKRIGDRRHCFKGVLDYAWALEQGRDKGYHCHFLFIYNGSMHMQDGYYAEQIGEVWLDITDGDGCYFNCNRKKHKDSYRKQGTLGIGMIHRNLDSEVENALKAINYLAKKDKDDQHLRVKIKGMRCFG